METPDGEVSGLLPADAGGPLRGEVRPPGDKSVTHRALLLGAVATGTTTVRGALDAADTRHTAGLASGLGAVVHWDRDDTVTLHGAAERLGSAADGGPTDWEMELDCGNAGTAARLVTGLLAGRRGRWTLGGDASLRRRPMGRVTEPLRAAGAKIEGKRLPLHIIGAPLSGVRHVVEVPSAQVKSALLLAGLVADGPTTVVQHTPTRDHTERMLPLFGVPVDVGPGEITVHPAVPRGAQVDVPADPSSAAFLLAAALLTPDSDVSVRDVGLWPRRTGFLRALERAQADVTVLCRQPTGSVTLGETAQTSHATQLGVDPRGDLRARASAFAAFEIAPEDVPDLVDEIPILAVLAARAQGTSRFAGLAELRLKESDRIATIAALLTSLGVSVELGEDSLVITGQDAFRPQGKQPRFDDHRLALAQAVALRSAGLPWRDGLGAAAISYPGFGKQLDALSAD